MTWNDQRNLRKLSSIFALLLKSITSVQRIRKSCQLNLPNVLKRGQRVAISNTTRTDQNKMEITGYLQQPINSDDETDIIGWQSDRGQDEHHSDQSGAGDAGRSDTGQSGR